MILKSSLFSSGNFRGWPRDNATIRKHPLALCGSLIYQKKKFLLSSILSPYLFFNDNSLQRHEFPPKFLAKYGWTKQIGVIYAITETSVQAPETSRIAVWILLWASAQKVLFIQKPLISPASPGLIPYWGVLFHIQSVASSGLREQFFPSKAYSLSSIHVILHLGSPFPSEVESKKTNSKSIKFRWDDIVGILLK